MSQEEVAAADEALPGPATLRRTITSLIRSPAGSKVEAEFADYVNNTCKSFVRAFEGAPVDAAIVVDPELANALPTHSSDKLFELMSRKSTSDEKFLLPVEIKSHAPTTNTTMFRGEKRRYHTASNSIVISDTQLRDGQILIIGSLVDSDYVAVLPMDYMRDLPITKMGGIQLGLSTIGLSLVNPLPATLAPFVMPKLLAEAQFRNFIDHARDPQVKIKNPYSGIEYQRSITFETHPFSTLQTASRTPENDVKFTLWQKFKQAYGEENSTYAVRNPVIAPLTSDLRIDHASGTQIFVEIKHAHASVVNLPGGRQKLSHLSKSRRISAGIFTMFVPWDYIMTFTTEVEGYLICKDDIPDNFWHQLGTEGRVSVEFDDHTFLDARRIRLDAANDGLVQRIERIIQQNGNSPVKATLSPTDILEKAGPCPWSYLKSIDGADLTEADVPDNVSEEDDEPGESEASVDDEAEANAGDQGAHGWLRKGLVARKLQNYRGQEMTQNERYFVALLKECRRRGQGCVIDLGRHHPYGNFAMVPYAWTENDKEKFDRKGYPPVWFGMLPSNTPMVAMLTQRIHWSYGNYAPPEPTPVDVARKAAAPPCLLVCAPLPREIGERVVERWIIPSLYTLNVHLGAVRGDDKAACPMILKDKTAIDNFLVPEERLYDNIYAFLKGDATIKIGLGEIKIEPDVYLSNVGHAKEIGEVEFAKMVRGRSWKTDHLETIEPTEEEVAAVARELGD